LGVRRGVHGDVALVDPGGEEHRQPLGQLRPDLLDALLVRGPLALELVLAPDQLGDLVVVLRVAEGRVQDDGGREGLQDLHLDVVEVLAADRVRDDEVGPQRADRLDVQGRVAADRLDAAEVVRLGGRRVELVEVAVDGEADQLTAQGEDRLARAELLQRDDPLRPGGDVDGAPEVVGEGPGAGARRGVGAVGAVGGPAAGDEQGRRSDAAAEQPAAGELVDDRPGGTAGLEQVRDHRGLREVVASGRDALCEASLS
jgi:hypothetical protein